MPERGRKMSGGGLRPLKTALQLSSAPRKCALLSHTTAKVSAPARTPAVKSVDTEVCGQCAHELAAMSLQVSCRVL